MTDWPAYLGCDTCEAKQGEACYTLLARGPQALPSRYAEVPHSGRKMRGEPRKVRAGSATRARIADARGADSVPQRRAARKSATKATGWAAVAEQQRKRRETT